MIELRPLVSADVEICAQVHHTVWRETYSHLLPPSHWDTDTVERRSGQWKAIVEARVPVTLAVVDGNIAGFGMAGAPRGKGGVPAVTTHELYALNVLQQFHGAGVGQALLEALVPTDIPAELWVAELNPRGRRFYEKNGFIPDGARFEDRNGIVEIRLLRNPGLRRD